MLSDDEPDDATAVRVAEPETYLGPISSTRTNSVASEDESEEAEQCSTDHEEDSQPLSQATTGNHSTLVSGYNASELEEVFGEADSSD